MNGATQCTPCLINLKLLHQSLQSELKLLGYSEEGLKYSYTLLRLIKQYVAIY